MSLYLYQGDGTIHSFFLPLGIYLTNICCTTAMCQVLSWVLKYNNEQINLSCQVTLMSVGKEKINKHKYNMLGGKKCYEEN